MPPLADDQIALNSWAADDLGAKPGDTIRVTYFEPESTHGTVREATAEFRLAAVVQLSGAAADRALTPAVRGITDQLSHGQLGSALPLRSAAAIRPKDERTGGSTGRRPRRSCRWPPAGGCGRAASGRPLRCGSAAGRHDRRRRSQQKLVLDPAAMGFVFQPVKQQGLAASAGTTPFGVLFLAFSSFVIAAAVMLVVLLFRLGIDRRAAQVGMLLAVGFRPRQVARLLAAEGLLVAALGSRAGGGGRHRLRGPDAGRPADLVAGGRRARRSCGCTSTP